MKEQSGRSLIEIIGVLTIGTIMIVAAYRIYNTIDQRQKHMIASDTLKEIATKTKTLYEYSGYRDVDITQLVKDGVLKDSKTPIGSDWEIKGSEDKFVIILNGLSFDDCEYFDIKKADWATSVSARCEKSQTNKVIFTVK